jgi:hypothetical protein
MRFMVDGVELTTKRLPFEGEGAGHILQILVPHSSNRVSRIWDLLLLVITPDRFQGVMTKEWIKEYSENRDEGDNSEIRIIHGLELRVVDELRMHGLGVKQVD